MSWIIISTILIICLAIFTGAAIYFILKDDDKSVNASRNILNKFEPDNTSPKLTKMIEFHKQHEELKKYNIN